MLLLFDIDGTLLRGADEPHFEALYATLEDSFGIPVVPGEIDLAGRTDMEIARMALQERGLPPVEIENTLDRLPEPWYAEFVRRCPVDLSSYVTPNMAGLLEQLDRGDGARLSLVTGNLQPIARLKLERAGLLRFFPDGQGAFGSDAEDRDDLPPIARTRAGVNGQPHPRDRTILIGDTPRDITCAEADGIRSFALATGKYSPAELQAATAVASDANGLAGLLDLALGAPRGRTSVG